MTLGFGTGEFASTPLTGPAGVVRLSEPTKGLGDVRRLLFKDFSGDGLIDRYQINGGDVAPVVPVIGAIISNSGARAVPVTIDNGAGTTTAIEFRQTTDSTVYTANVIGETAVFPQQNIAHAMLLVASFTTTVMGSTSNTVRYSYGGGEFHLQGLGFLGFRQVNSTDLSRNKTTFATFDMSADRRSHGQMVSGGSIVWGTNVAPTIVATYNVALNCSVTAAQPPRLFTVLRSGKSGCLFDLDGTLLENSTMFAVHDDHGNVVHSSTTAVDAFDAYTTEIVNEFADNETTWTLGVLTSTTQKHSLRSSSEVVTLSSNFVYDPLTTLLVQDRSEAATNMELMGTYSSDAFGNTNGSQLAGCRLAQRHHLAFFDQSGQFPVTYVDALKHKSSVQHEPAYGGVVSSTDSNGLTTSFEFDTFGRLLTTHFPDGSFAKDSYELCSAVEPSQVACPPSGYAVRSQRAHDNVVVSVVLDARGHVVRTQAPAMDGRRIFCDTVYDDIGRMSQRSEPYFEGDTPAWNSYFYDALDRVVRLRFPDGSSATFEHAGGNVTQIDALGRRNTRVYNSQKQLVRSVDAAGQVMSFEYTPTGFVKRVVDPHGNVISAAYTSRGHKLWMDGPDFGNWTFSHNAAGELVSWPWRCICMCHVNTSSL